MISSPFDGKKCFDSMSCSTKQQRGINQQKVRSKPRIMSNASIQVGKNGRLEQKIRSVEQRIGGVSR